jgi:hypothetical protein
MLSKYRAVTRISLLQQRATMVLTIGIIAILNKAASVGGYHISANKPDIDPPIAVTMNGLDNTGY